MPARARDDTIAACRPCPRESAVPPSPRGAEDTTTSSPCPSWDRRCRFGKALDFIQQLLQLARSIEAPVLIQGLRPFSSFPPCVGSLQRPRNVCWFCRVNHVRVCSLQEP